MALFIEADEGGELPATIFPTLMTAAWQAVELKHFGQAHLPYLIVRDKFNLTGYGSDHSVNVATAFASVHSDVRRTKEAAWDTDLAFSASGKHKLLFGELTQEAARKVANGLMDYVRDNVLVANHLASSPYQGKIQPFMTAVSGHVLIHDGYTGNPYGDDWTGICVDGSDVKKFWYIGRCGGERSYCALAAKDIRSAILESQPFIDFEQQENAALV